MTATIHIFTVGPDGKSMTCHLCGYTTISAQHVAELYCGQCDIFLTDVTDATDRARAMGVMSAEPTEHLAFLRRLVGKLRGVGMSNHSR